MLEGVDVPFKYKRKQAYKSLVGARVNLTYYPCNETVAGIDGERVSRVVEGGDLRSVGVNSQLVRSRLPYRGF